MYRFIDHNMERRYPQDLEFFTTQTVEVLRPILFFARGQHITMDKLLEYYTDKAIIAFVGDGYIEIRDEIINKNRWEINRD